MKTFILSGLPEGIVGMRTVKAKSIDELYSRHPALRAISAKLNVQAVGTRISVRGYSPCDG